MGSRQGFDEEIARRTVRQRGSGKLEFLLVVAVFGVLASVLMSRLLEVERDAERTEVDLTIRNLRVGLRLAVGEFMMRGEDDRLGELVQGNPVRFLGHEPRGYVGESETPVEPGNWRFDPTHKTLIYRVRQPEAFAGRQELQWRMTAQNQTGRRIQGIKLELIER